MRKFECTTSFYIESYPKETYNHFIPLEQILSRSKLNLAERFSITMYWDSWLGFFCFELDLAFLLSLRYSFFVPVKFVPTIGRYLLKESLPALIQKRLSAIQKLNLPDSQYEFVGSIFVGCKEHGISEELQIFSEKGKIHVFFRSGRKCSGKDPEKVTEGILRRLFK